MSKGYNRKLSTKKNQQHKTLSNTHVFVCCVNFTASTRRKENTDKTLDVVYIQQFFHVPLSGHKGIRFPVAAAQVLHDVKECCAPEPRWLYCCCCCFVATASSSAVVCHALLTFCCERVFGSVLFCMVCWDDTPPHHTLSGNWVTHNDEKKKCKWAILCDWATGRRFASVYVCLRVCVWISQHKSNPICRRCAVFETRSVDGWTTVKT